MRTEQEMYRLILEVAREDERVRLVGLNGSRANAKVPKDIFQDYDIVYVVTDMESFTEGDHWIEVFGKQIMMQKPDSMELFPSRVEGWFTYLMLFEDGNRIDLTLVPLEDLDNYLGRSKLTVILLDKDSRAKSYPKPSDEDYHVKKPASGCYLDCCNEFWWVATYVAKGLCRDELIYAAEHMASCVRRQLLTMLSWKVGIETDFSLSVGKLGKYLKRFISGTEWMLLQTTYRMDTLEYGWEALEASMKLFRQASIYVGERLGYEYPQYDNKVSAYISTLRQEYGTLREQMGVELR